MRGLRENPWAVLVTVSLGFFMTLLDTTIVNIAAPSMMSHLHASLDQVLWVLNGYTLAFAALLLFGGRLGDLFGRRRMLIAGLMIFVVASVLCGLAQNPAELIAMRVIQGIGAAVMMPQTLALVIAVFPEDRRGAAFGIWSAVAGLATVIAPTLGGVLVTYESWRWIFFVNLPIGVVSVALALIVVPDVKARGRAHMDPPGVLLSAAALLAITYGLIEGQRYSWGRIWSFISIPLLIGAGIVCLGLFVLLERRRQERGPLVPFALFGSRDFGVMSFVTATVLFGTVGLLLPLMIYMQLVLGLSALATGLTLLPMTIVMLGLAPAAGKLADRSGGKGILIGGLVVFAAGLVTTALAAQAASSRWILLPGLLLVGAGTGLAFAPMNTLAMRGVREELAGAASGIISTARQLGAVLGSVAVGALLQNRLASAMITEAQPRVQAVPPLARRAVISGFRAMAGNGLQIGAGRTEGYVPAGLSGSVASQVRQVTSQIFSHGFVTAFRPSVMLPAVVLLLGALATLLIRRPPAGTQAASKAAAEKEISSAAP